MTLDKPSGMIARTYKIFTWLSLDVTAGAIVFMYFLAQEFGVPVRWSEAAALGLAVWVIYSIDHLLDARVAIEPISERREFHREHSKVLLLLTLLAVVSGTWIVTLLSTEVIISGGILAMVAIGYLAVAQIKKWSGFKEVQIAFGYVAGVSLVPLVNLEIVEPWYWLTTGLLFLTALTNLILFSWYERKQDQSEGFTSLVLALGEKKISSILTLMFVLTLLGAIVLSQNVDSWRSVIFFLTAGVINFGLWKYSNFFSQNNRYRSVGDAVFLLPIIWLI